MSFLDNLNGVSAQTIKTLSDTKNEIPEEYKGIIDFCIDDATENVDSFGGNGYEGNGYEGNGFAGNGFEDFGGNGENFLENYNFDEINDFWQEG